MKEMKTVAIATLIVCSILISCACTMFACAEEDFYPVVMMVVGTEEAEEAEEVIVTDCMGEEFGFLTPIGEFQAGDLLVVFFSDNHGVVDDEILEIKYLGSSTPEMFQNWRAD